MGDFDRLVQGLAEAVAILAIIAVATRFIMWLWKGKLIAKANGTSGEQPIIFWSEKFDALGKKMDTAGERIGDKLAEKVGSILDQQTSILGQEAENSREMINLQHEILKNQALTHQLLQVLMSKQD